MISLSHGTDTPLGAQPTYTLFSVVARILTISSKNSAQKTIHDMLDHNPHFLRPRSRVEMYERIRAVSDSSSQSHSCEDQIMSRDSIEAKDQVNRILPVHDTRWKQGVKGAHVYRGLPGHIDMKDKVVEDRVSTEAPSTRFSFKTTPNPNRSHRVPQPLTRRSTMDSSATESSTVSLKQLRRVASGYSDRGLRHIQRALKGLSLSSSSTSSDLTALTSVSSTMEHQPSFLSPTPPVVPLLYPANEDQPHPGLATAGDLMNPKAYQFTCSRRGLHKAKLCWCSIAEALANDPNAWFLSTGDLSARALALLAGQHPLAPDVRDGFGNTPLHLVASIDGYEEELFRFISAGVDMNARNTAGQTFLHVLAASWFGDCSSPTPPLKRLVGIVRQSHPDLAFVRDHYGRTFFHRLYKIVDNNELSTNLISAYYPLESIILDRDAFGFNSMERPAIMKLPPPSYITLEEAHANTLLEDVEGRNGLQCLAEAKSPRDLQALLAITDGIDLNHYDRSGNSVLAAIITHIPDNLEDNSKSILRIFETLIDHGADIEARNRRAETALLVAARLGRKIALAVLLERGANVHARDIDGRGVLEIISNRLHIPAVKEDLSLYARLEACRALLVHSKNRNWGVVHRPTVLQEWGVRGDSENLRPNRDRVCVKATGIDMDERLRTNKIASRTHDENQIFANRASPGTDLNRLPTPNLTTGSVSRGMTLPPGFSSTWAIKAAETDLIETGTWDKLATGASSAKSESGYASAGTPPNARSTRLSRTEKWIIDARRQSLVESMLNEPADSDCSSEFQDIFGRIEDAKLNPGASSQKSSNSIDSDLLSMSDFSEVSDLAATSEEESMLPILNEAVERLLHGFIRKHAFNENQSSEVRSAHGPTFSNQPSQGSARPENNGKRRTEGEQEDRSGEAALSRAPKRRKPNEANPRCLACPFWKKDVTRYQRCCQLTLKRIRDVKQHLHRRHTPEFYCERCFTIFPGPDSHESHIINATCLRGPDAQLEGISHANRRRLSNKSNPALTEERQWFTIWDILFPRVKRPSSAYVDPGLSLDLRLFREHWQNSGEEVLLDILRSNQWTSLSEGEQETHGRRILAAGLERIYQDWLSSRSPITTSTQASTSFADSLIDRAGNDNSLSTPSESLLTSVPSMPPGSGIPLPRGRVSENGQNLISPSNLEARVSFENGDGNNIGIDEIDMYRTDGVGSLPEFSLCDFNLFSNDWERE